MPQIGMRFLKRKESYIRIMLPDFDVSDDFVQAFSKLMKNMQWFGTAWNNNCIYSMWGKRLFVASITCGLVATGNLISERHFASILSRLFIVNRFMTSAISLLLVQRVKKHWTSISSEWILSFDRSLLTRDLTLGKRIYAASFAFFILVPIDRVFTLASSVVENDSTSLNVLRIYASKTLKYSVNLDSRSSIYLVTFLATMDFNSRVIINIQYLIVVAFSMALASKQRRINSLIAKICDRNSTLNGRYNLSPIYIVKERILTWRRVRETHVQYSRLVDKINVAIGPSIFVTSFYNFFMFTLMLAFGNTSTNAVSLANYLTSLVLFCGRTLFILLRATDVHSLSQEALLSLANVDTAGYDVEVGRLQLQMGKHAIALNGMGYFDLKRIFILKALGMILTYVLILLQFSTIA